MPREGMAKPVLLPSVCPSHGMVKNRAKSRAVSKWEEMSLFMERKKASAAGRQRQEGM